MISAELQFKIVYILFSDILFANISFTIFVFWTV